MKQIKKFDIGHLANGAHFLFITDVTECAEKDAKLKTKAAGEIATLRKALTAEDAALKLAQKNLLSDEIKRADERRDTLYRTFKKFVEAAVDFPVKASAEAAVRLRQLLKEYNINPQMQLDRETGMLLNLITDLSGKFNNDVMRLGLTPLLVELKTVNQQLRTATNKRTNDRMLKIIGQLKLARTASDEAYRTLVLKANALAVIEGEADYELPAFEQENGFAPGTLSLTGKTAKGEDGAKLYELKSTSGDSFWVKVEDGKLVKVEKAS